MVITEIPYTCTTVSLIDSIISANDKRKIKIINLAPGVSPDQTIDALYAFTDCVL